MIKVIPNSKDTIIGEEHLYTIKFGLEDVLKVYKKEVEKYNKMDYSKMTGEEIHLMKWYENKVFDNEKLLKEIDEAIDNLDN